MDTDTDLEATSMWYRAPQDIGATEAQCTLCRQAVRPGQIIADDGPEVIHQRCYNDTREDYYDAQRVR